MFLSFSIFPCILDISLFFLYLIFKTQLHTDYSEAPVMSKETTHETVFSFSPSLKRRLRTLAQKYETPRFLIGDPSTFMHRYSDTRDIEIVALIGAVLAFGRRDAILAHIEQILAAIGDESPAEWILAGNYRDAFPDCKKSFYRIFSFKNMRCLFYGLRTILLEHHSLGQCLERDYKNGKCQCQPGRLAAVLAEHFPTCCSPLISQGKNSASKRLNLFLRWMVRTGSPVDLGLWTWYPPTELIMPLDIHVMQTAIRFKLLPATARPDLKTAILLTEIMKTIFPNDPLKGDFALFGYGVDSAE